MYALRAKPISIRVLSSPNETILLAIISPSSPSPQQHHLSQSVGSDLLGLTFDSVNHLPFSSGSMPTLKNSVAFVIAVSMKLLVVINIRVFHLRP